MRPMPIPALYRSLHQYLMQRIPDECESRLSNMIYLMMGMFQARSANTSQEAEYRQTLRAFSEEWGGESARVV